jgi:hypothetical protein
MHNEPARHQSPDEEGESLPPFGVSWRTLYVVVLVNLAVLVALFYLLTRAFR